MAVAIRRSVWSLPPGDQTLDWYRKAVAELITRPPSDPSSWRYLAAVHGVPIDMCGSIIGKRLFGSMPTPELVLSALA